MLAVWVCPTGPKGLHRSCGEHTDAISKPFRLTFLFKCLINGRKKQTKKNKILTQKLDIFGFEFVLLPRLLPLNRCFVFLFFFVAIIKYTL